MVDCGHKKNQNYFLSAFRIFRNTLFYSEEKYGLLSFPNKFWLFLKAYLDTEIWMSQIQTITEIKIILFNLCKAIMRFLQKSLLG